MVYGNQLYVAAANYSASNSNDASALYSLTYANTFYNSSGVNYNATPALVSNALSSAQGVWPTQFALHQFVPHTIGVDDVCAQVLEASRYGALSAGDASGEAKGESEARSPRSKINSPQAALPSKSSF